jgi:hypothetical protein
LGNCVVPAVDVRRIILRADDNEIVPGDLASDDAVAFADEFLLGFRVMYQHEIRIASPCRLKGLTRALRDDINVNPGRLREKRQDAAKQSGILDGGRRSQHDRRRRHAV